MKFRLLICASALMLLGGCASMARNSESATAEARWQQRSAQLQQVDRFLMQARGSYGRLIPTKADLRWQQNADGSFELRIAGPFGIGATTISGTERQVQVRTRSGTYQSSDPEQWIADKMGWTLPLAGLRHWVLGLPSPHSEARLDLNLEGQVTTLQQDGWTLVYSEYQRSGGYELPRKFEVSNTDVRLKVVVDSWTGLPPPR
jgi:outer membrane lipoprotein LolB